MNLVTFQLNPKSISSEKSPGSTLKEMISNLTLKLSSFFLGEESSLVPAGSMLGYCGVVLASLIPEEDKSLTSGMITIGLLKVT